VTARYLIRSAQITLGRELVVADVLVADGVIRDIAPRLQVVSPEQALVIEVDAGGAALLPGLHDHHIHLFATAAADSSLRCGPPQVTDREQFAAVLTTAPGTGWLRGIGYDESVAGPLDRVVLDGLIAGRPVRVQHRGGSLWSLNSAAVEALALGDVTEPGVERDATGRPTGRLWRMDHWLRDALATTDNAQPPDLAALGKRLAACGVTGVTDATPGDTTALAEASVRLPQRVWSMGEPHPRLGLAPRKIVIGDHALPGIDELCAAIAASHFEGRPVALHSVTREAIFLLLAAFDEVGAMPGDRIEHAAICPLQAVKRIHAHGLAVVTQPSLLATRGDDYLDNVEAEDVPNLWRFRSLCEAGIAVGMSSDAPYGSVDPWFGIRAAEMRMAPDGRVVGRDDRVPPATALAGYLSPPLAPGASPRTLQVGNSADLVLLDAPLGDILREPSAERVRWTLIGGVTAYLKESLA
jgi:predicted amidohydrolase YtcJ